MIWIVETKDNKIYNIDNSQIGQFIKDNKVIECQLKK